MSNEIQEWQPRLPPGWHVRSMHVSAATLGSDTGFWQQVSRVEVELVHVSEVVVELIFDKVPDTDNLYRLLEHLISYDEHAGYFTVIRPDKVTNAGVGIRNSSELTTGMAPPTGLGDGKAGVLPRLR